MPWRLSYRHISSLSRRFPTKARYFSQSSATQTANYDPSKIRNLALVAHIDSGKTTLTESILLKSNFLSVSGTVDTGSTTTDFLPAERERGITIQSASIPVAWKEWQFNLIDTPGHADFGMEVESASRVVDGAVVLIDAVEGVESQTQGVWRQLDRYGVSSRILFLNKLDRSGASLRASISSILNFRLHPKPTLLALPVASFSPKDYDSAEPGIAGLVDLVKWEIHVFDGGSSSQRALPKSLAELKESDIFPPSHPLVDELLPARTAMLENVAMSSEQLMETLLDLPDDPSANLQLNSEDVIAALRSATLKNDILPVLCGSAFHHIGTEMVMNYAGHLLASPVDVSFKEASGSDDVRMLAWKVVWDQRRGWMTFVRVYSGVLTRQTALHNATRNVKEKTSKLLLLYASQPEEVESLPFGSVGVILGLKHTRTGDTLVSFGRSSKSQINETMRDITLPTAVMSASIIPQSQSDLQPVQDALAALTRTDPSARFEVTEGQLLVHGLGALHLEIIEGRLRDEWGVRFEAGRRRVTFRESFGGSEKAMSEDWHTDVHGRQITVKMDLLIRALREDEEGDSLWDGNAIVDPKGRPLRLTDSVQDNQPTTYIAQGCSNVLSSSPHSSLPLTRLFVQIQRYSIPDNISASVLAGATSFILRKAIQESGMGPIMEPFIHLKITAREEHVGKVISDLTEHGGEISDFSNSQSSVDSDSDFDSLPYSSEGVYIPPVWISPSASNVFVGHSSTGLKRTIDATAPLSQLLDYSNRLRALTGGHGTFEMTSAGFRTISHDRELEILREIGRA